MQSRDVAIWEPRNLSNKALPYCSEVSASLVKELYYLHVGIYIII